jgi:hypothetical protein
MLGTLCCPGSLSCPVPSLSLAWRQFQLSKFGRHLSWLSDVCYTHCCRVMRTRYSRISMTVLCTLCCQKIKLCRLNKRTAAKESHIMYRSFWEGCPLARNVFGESTRAITVHGFARRMTLFKLKDGATVGPDVNLTICS